MAGPKFPKSYSKNTNVGCLGYPPHYPYMTSSGPSHALKISTQTQKWNIINNNNNDTQMLIKTII